MTPSDLRQKFGIGLTGNIATGKSTIARIATQAGFWTLDADALSRLVTAPGHPGLAAVTQALGTGYLQPDGSLNRKALAADLFRDIELRRRLEKVLWPLIEEEGDRALRASGLVSRPRPWIYEAARLFESGRNRDFGQVWLTDCPKNLQLERLMRRDGLTADEAERRIQAQGPLEQKRLLATWIIDTSRPESEIAAEVVERLRVLEQPRS